MSDIKLFRLNEENVTELQGQSATLERSIQNRIEKNLSALLGVRFLASEYTTGKKHGGRIDTLGIDENACPVIIEYKRALNENIINQGLFYLDWLLDHKAEFKLLVMEKLGNEEAGKIEWSSPRMLCIAGDFTKYDVHAIQQINRNIELIRYRKFGEDLLLFDLVNATTASPKPAEDSQDDTADSSAKSGRLLVKDALTQADTILKDWFEQLKSFLLNLGDDVQMKELKYYIAFKRLKNFACIEVHPQSKKLVVYVRVDPESVDLEEGFTRDVRGIGHLGTGDLEITIKSGAGLMLSQALLVKSYEAS